MGANPIFLETRSQPKGRGHAAQPGKAVTHSSPVFQCHTCEWPLSTRICQGPWRKGYRANRKVVLARPRLIPWPPQSVLGWGFHDWERQDKSLASAEVLAKFPLKTQERQLLLKEQTFSYQPAATRASTTTKTTLEGTGEVMGDSLHIKLRGSGGRWHLSHPRPRKGGGRQGGGAHQLPPRGGLQLPAPPGPSGRARASARPPQRPEPGARSRTTRRLTRPPGAAASRT